MAGHPHWLAAGWHRRGAYRRWNYPGGTPQGVEADERAHHPGRVYSPPLRVRERSRLPSPIDHGTMRNLMWVTTGAVLVLSACANPTPEGSPVPAVAPSETNGSHSVFTAELVARVRQMMEREYPPLLRDAGVGGDVVVHFNILADGRVSDIHVQSANQEMFGTAARRIVSRLEFGPAAAVGRIVPLGADGVLRFRQGRAHEVIFNAAAVPRSR